MNGKSFVINHTATCGVISTSLRPTAQSIAVEPRVSKRGLAMPHVNRVVIGVNDQKQSAEFVIGRLQRLLVVVGFTYCVIFATLQNLFFTAMVQGDFFGWMSRIYYRWGVAS